MNTNKIFMCLGLAAIMMEGCGTTKTVVAPATTNTTPRQETPAPTRVRRDVDPVYTLAKQEGANLRAASSATAFMEDVALENAENAAASLIASRLESAIIAVRERFNKTNQVNYKSLTEQQVQNYTKTFVSQKISYKVIGEPSVYDNPDRSITAYVCVELRTPTKQILEDAFDKMTEDEVLKTEFDKKRFVDENMEELKKLQNKVGL